MENTVETISADKRNVLTHMYWLLVYLVMAEFFAALSVLGVFMPEINSVANWVQRILLLLLYAVMLTGFRKVLTTKNVVGGVLLLFLVIVRIIFSFVPVGNNAMLFGACSAVLMIAGMVGLYLLFSNSEFPKSVKACVLTLVWFPLVLSFILVIVEMTPAKITDVEIYWFVNHAASCVIYFLLTCWCFVSLTKYKRS